VKEYAKIRISNWLGIAYQLVAKYRLSQNRFLMQIGLWLFMGISIVFTAWGMATDPKKKDNLEV